MGPRFKLADWLHAYFNRKVLALLGGARRPVFHDPKAELPELLEIDRNVEVIRQELLRVLPAGGEIPRYHDVDGTQTDIASLGETDWRVFFLHDESTSRRCTGPARLPQSSDESSRKRAPRGAEPGSFFEDSATATRRSP